MIRYREALVADVPEMEQLRLPDTDAGPADRRMARYLNGKHHPQKALTRRVMYVAEDEDSIIGYIGGHLTERYDCEGELQYLYVAPAYRRAGIASGMLRSLWRWFRDNDARRICVDVEPDNAAARRFYAAHGATHLDTHWLVWSDIGSGDGPA